MDVLSVERLYAFDSALRNPRVACCLLGFTLAEMAGYDIVFSEAEIRAMGEMGDKRYEAALDDYLRGDDSGFAVDDEELSAVTRAEDRAENPEGEFSSDDELTTYNRELRDKMHDRAVVKAHETWGIWIEGEEPKPRPWPAPRRSLAEIEEITRASEIKSVGRTQG